MVIRPKRLVNRKREENRLPVESPGEELGQLTEWIWSPLALDELSVPTLLSRCYSWRRANGHFTKSQGPY
jgi:hypothetical protein